jgi:Reverse transcriptase (RNA-dependent DNA polymerase)/RNase H-like domain found in reverse transcriptase
MVPKSDGSLRFCVDYRRLNAITVPNTYPLPRMDECIASLGDAAIFTTLDCNSGYWQIPVHPADRDGTTFTSHCGIYRFLRLPFGLRNAPATFQRAVDVILAGMTWRTCLVYLDDAIIYSPDKASHLRHVAKALNLLREAGLSLKLKKCLFFSQTVDHLGHVIRPGRLGVAEKNTDALRDAALQRTQTELRSFLGLFNVNRRLVPHFASLVAPLNVYLTKGKPPVLGILSDPAVAAFNSLRQKLLSPPVLALPRREGKLWLDTDASAAQLGCCLLQEQPFGPALPLGYWSRSLSAAERNYSTTEKECLAIV